MYKQTYVPKNHIMHGKAFDALVKHARIEKHVTIRNTSLSETRHHMPASFEVF